MYRPDHVDKTFDDGFVSMFADNKYRRDIVVRLCYENERHFQWVK